MNFDKNLKKIREDKGYTMAYIAKTLEIPYRTYQDYELGLRELSLVNALKIAKFYKISVEKLCSYGE